MPKPTQAQQALFDHMVEIIPFKASGPPKYKFRIVEIDEVPEEDSRGYRRAEGFKMVWETQVEEGWGNFVGAMHGAAAAWIADTCTSAALVGLHTETFWGPPMMAGVSLSLDMQYFHPAPTDTKIRILVEVLKITTTLANLKCEIRDAETDKLYCLGTHIKAWKPQKAKL